MGLDSDSIMTARLSNLCGLIISHTEHAAKNVRRMNMKKLPLVALSLLLAISFALAAQNQNANATGNANSKRKT